MVRILIMNLLLEKDNYGQAYIYLNDSYPYLQKLSLEELPDKQELLYNIGYVNYMIGYDAKALKFLDEAEKLSNQYYPMLECNITNTKGLIYEQSGNEQKAMENFRQVLKLAEEIPNKIWMRVAKNSIANLYINKGNYKEALDYLNGFPELDSNESEEVGVVETKRMTLLGKIYVAQNEWGKLSQVTP